MRQLRKVLFTAETEADLSRGKTNFDGGLNCKARQFNPGVI